MDRRARAALPLPVDRLGKALHHEFRTRQRKVDRRLLSTNSSIAAVIELEFFEVVVEVRKDLEAAGLHPRQHIHQTGLDRN